MYELAIIGAGAAGITCAKEAKKAGLRTVLIEKEKDSLGGTCLNQGCIPTKFFLKSSQAHKTWPDTFNQSQTLTKKIKLSLLALLEKQGLDLVWGSAQLLGKNSLVADGKTIKAKNIIIATGSSPKPSLKSPRVIFAEEIFSKETFGDKILIIGAGYIGVETASLLQGFGKSVYLVEKEEQILPSFDPYLAQRLRVILESKGINIATGQDIDGYNLNDFDLVISAVGRVPNLEGLGAEAIGLVKSPQGWLVANKYLRTNIKNIYACGDITGRKLLAYVAEYQAGICIDNIKGKKRKEDYQGLSECVFSSPSLAKVGILEEEAKTRGIKYRLVKSNFLRFSSAYVYGDTDGFIEILIDKRKKIIGAGIISQASAELISIFSLCIRNNLSLDSLKRCLFIHPTLSEIIPQLLNSELAVGRQKQH
ncbi:MAG: NAD(P)/FAD-dependent oxidoreductase [Candidatus Omnitrophota bacterium]